MATKDVKLIIVYLFQMKTAQLEWSYNWKVLQDKKSTSDDVTDLNNMGHPSRHQRLLRKHIVELTKSTRQLKDSNKDLQSKIRSMEMNMRKMQHGDYSRHENDLNEQENELLLDNRQPLDERVAKMESLQKTSLLSIFNLTQQMTSYDKLHISMLELLENVESIEAKVDKSVPDFRKEISKLEFQMAQTVTKVSALKEDQTNTRESVKAISVSVSNLKDKFAIKLNSFEKMNKTVIQLIESASVQNSKLHDHILKVRLI